MLNQSNRPLNSTVFGLRSTSTHQISNQQQDSTHLEYSLLKENAKQILRYCRELEQQNTDLRRQLFHYTTLKKKQKDTIYLEKLIRDQKQKHYVEIKRLSEAIRCQEDLITKLSTNRFDKFRIGNSFDMTERQKMKVTPNYRYSNNKFQKKFIYKKEDIKNQNFPLFVKQKQNWVYNFEHMQKNKENQDISPILFKQNYSDIDLYCDQILQEQFQGCKDSYLQKLFESSKQFPLSPEFD